jgi:hypothetical protein
MLLFGVGDVQVLKGDVTTPFSDLPSDWQKAGESGDRRKTGKVEEEKQLAEGYNRE